VKPCEYDAFAADYAWLLSDERLTGEPFVAAHKELLEALPPGAKLLDCACGIGVQALALARHGHRVWGTDASAGMIAQAQRRAREAGLDLPLATCRWEELPRRFPEPFDLAFCCGNAIGHCRDADEMLRSLRGIHSVLKDDGRLVLDSRNWEKMWDDRQRFHTFGVRVRHGVRGIPLCVWTYPERWGEPFLVEVVVLLEQDGRVTLRSYPVTYYPFRLDELLSRLADAGFGDVATTYAEGEAGYTVTARRRAPRAR
jgi:SAM-dependent methyltransferase